MKIRGLFLAALPLLSLLQVASVVAQIAPRSAPANVGQVASLTGRVPAVPLVTHDPYFSVWSMADKLTDAPTKHWTGADQPLTGIVRIDGKSFRFCGNNPSDVPPLPQMRNEITPTRTIYTFEGEGVRLKVTFTSPLLPDNIEVMSRPVTYISFEPSSTDGQVHRVSVYFDLAPHLTVNRPNQEVKASRTVVKGLDTVRTGTTAQPVLRKKGDDLRIDWGYAYLAVPEAAPRGSWAKIAANKLIQSGITTGQIATIVPATTRLDFAFNGSFPASDEAGKPHPAREAPVLAALCDFGEVGGPAKAGKPVVAKKQHLLLAYDDLFSINLMGRKLPPYWRRAGMDAAKLLQVAEREMPDLEKRCVAFDAELLRDAQATGGPAYARLVALAYRQAFAAHKIVADEKGRALQFSKENFSNGCIGTVDVIYPTAPLLLLLNPELLKGQLIPVLDYAASPRWKFPFAPHDLGTYPRATGQVYGGGELTEKDQMPVEESGNMLIVLAALARVDGNANFSKPYFPQIDKWAAYLKDKGLDPENQLCTDDFAGHLAHNTNLSLKAIVALGSYAVLCDYAGRKEQAELYRATAKDMAQKWAPMADDGDHYRLAFDRPGTWSQKYNIVWDKLLNLGLFDAVIARKEMAFYNGKLNPYGLPLDNRKGYTKLDWCVWTATLAADKAEFEKFVTPLDKFIRETPDRVPLTDWYETIEGKKSGFQARSVVGGVLIKYLADAALWKKYATRGGKVKPLPAGVKVLTEPASPDTNEEEISDVPEKPAGVLLVPTAQDDKNIQWRYTTTKPANGWEKPAFKGNEWQTGAGGFGTEGTPGAIVGTVWNSSDIWLRRTFALPASALTPQGRKQLYLWLHHDEDIDVYINGVPALSLNGYINTYAKFEISEAARAALKPSNNVLSVHCTQTGGGQFVDVGIGREAPTP